MKQRDILVYLCDIAQACARLRQFTTGKIFTIFCLDDEVHFTIPKSRRQISDIEQPLTGRNLIKSTDLFPK